MFSLRDEDAWADYLPSNREKSVPGAARSPSPVTMPETAKDPAESPEAFYEWLVANSAHVNLAELSTTPVEWDKLPECDVCASGHKLDVLRLARSCLCSPYPCSGHVCACATNNVTPAGLYHTLLHLSVYITCFFVVYSFNRIASMLQPLCCQYTVAAYSRPFASCWTISCKMSIL